MWKEMLYLVVPLIMPTVSTMFINGITVIFTIGHMGISRTKIYTEHHTIRS